ncbi:MAG: hypothetical protein KAU50_08790 [Candidatus Marinimicrobia bacterium]|nr:hypothetical protein [Candidatus Neomarinimicrobiota bacterium]
MTSTVKFKPVKQGGSVPLSYGVADRSGDKDMSVNWTCRIQVKSDITDNAPIQDFTLTDFNGDNTRFLGLLQTAALNAGDYWILAELENIATGERGEVHGILEVQVQGVFDPI